MEGKGKPGFGHMGTMDLLVNEVKGGQLRGWLDGLNNWSD